jgi:glycosyltransferase involved in cell wall biosynthesis
MDQNTQLEIIKILHALFSDTQVKEEDKQHLSSIIITTSEASQEGMKALTERLSSTVFPHDNPLALYFFLFDICKEPKFINMVFDSIGEYLSPAMYYDLFWNLSRRSFIGQSMGSDINKKLRQHHKKISSHTNAFLDEIGMRPKRQATGVRNIAIISPQILNMRHSPTREAFNLALHLDTYFGCNTYIFNTNSMAYENVMGLIEQFEFHDNKGLKGGQVVSVDYMQFKKKDVRIMSFEPEPMSTRKLANILDTLNQLKIDAVIAHGENLLLQEAVFGVWPSIFATTGTVVPFAHSDAYFVPGHLHNESHEQLARDYGHSDFMLESMLVTPEGKAENSLQRNDFSIDSECFMYLVVGTRLNNEMTADFAQICQQLLEYSTDCVIAFAGTKTLKLQTYFSKESIDANRIINLGFQDDLPGVCKMADVFLNPYREGGGTSSQTAILNGLPIVTLNHGHISAVVPKALRQPDWQSYLDFAIALKADPKLYMDWQIKLEAHFIEHLNTKDQVRKIHQKLIDIAANKYR